MKIGFFIFIALFLTVIAGMKYADQGLDNLTPSAAFDKKDTKEERQNEASRQEAIKRLREVLWLEDFNNCLTHKGMLSEMMNAFSDEPERAHLEQQLLQTERTSFCPCLYNGFADALGKTTPFGIIRMDEHNQKNQEDYAKAKTIRKKVALSCMEHPKLNPRRRI